MSSGSKTNVQYRVFLFISVRALNYVLCGTTHVLILLHVIKIDII